MTPDRATIESAFGAPAFPHGLFHARPGGLRFELSEGIGPIDQFLSAMRKALAICEDVFVVDERVGICLSDHARGPAFGVRSALRALRDAGIRIPRTRPDVARGASPQVRALAA